MSQYAIYSEKQGKEHGFIEYKREDGSKVICTAVGATPDCGCSWDDQKEIGEVIGFVRRLDFGQDGNRHLN